MKVLLAFVVTAFLCLNTATAGERKKDLSEFSFYGAQYTVRSAIYSLTDAGVMSEEFLVIADGDTEKTTKLWKENIKWRVTGIKKIGLRPWYPEYTSLTPPKQGEMLYQLILHLTLKDLDGKVKEFIVIDTVSKESGVYSAAMVIEAVPPYRVIGTWQDYLQMWENIKNNNPEKNKDRRRFEITPNLVDQVKQPVFGW